MNKTPEAIIAIIEDDHDIAANIEVALQDHGFECHHFPTASDFYNKVDSIRPDLCLIDLGLPDKNGLDLVRTLNEDDGIASIIISGRRGLTDKIVGLEMGADDYISKPFETAELVARVRTVMRRSAKAQRAVDRAAQSSKAKFSDWTLDLVNYTLVDSNGAATPLSKAEMDIMKMFVDGPNRLFSRNQILDILNLDADQNFDRSVDVRISRLRSKLRENPQTPTLIKTVYGGGYMFVANVEWLN